MVRYIYNTSGKYVAFIYNNSLFTENGTWIGVIRNGNEVYNLSGDYVGYVSGDDRVICSKDISPNKKRVVINNRLMPLRPTFVPKPSPRLKMVKLLGPYCDAFENNIVFNNKFTNRRSSFRRFSPGRHLGRTYLMSAQRILKQEKIK